MSLTNLGAADATVAMAPGYRVLRVQSAAGVRVRAYRSAGARNADQGRAVGVFPSNPDSGLMFEVVDVADLWLPRPPDGYTSDGTDQVPLRVDSVGFAGSVDVVLTFVATEEMV